MDHSEDVLLKAAEHLYYEVCMMYKMGRLYLEKTHETDKVLSYAILESFLIHFRLLCEFLLRSKKDVTKWEDCIVAQHYADGWECYNGDEIESAPDEYRYLDKYRNIAHKQLAHLSSERVEACEWMITYLWDNTRTLLNEFLRQVNNQKLGKYKQEIDNLIQRELPVPPRGDSGAITTSPQEVYEDNSFKNTIESDGDKS